MTAYIYVLHFREKLKHAQHYIGCTTKLSQRLEAHACGAGSNLCRVLRDKGIEWQLGGLMQCTFTRMRQLERGLKEQANSSRYCELCTKNPYRFNGTTPVSIELVACPTISEALRPLAARPTPTIRHTTQDEPMEVIDQLTKLMRTDKDALGFIPCGGEQGLTGLARRGRVIVAEWNTLIVGYCAYTINLANDRIQIQQCCVIDECRFMGIGRMMVEGVQKVLPEARLLAKVRTDLAANHFWTSIGFACVATSQHKTSGSRIHSYTREPAQCLSTNLIEAGRSESTTTEAKTSLPTSSPELSGKPDTSTE